MFLWLKSTNVGI